MNTYTGTRRHARANRTSKEQLTFLAKCRQGDVVCFEDGEGVVDVVDPFNQNLLLQDGSYLDIRFVVLPGQ